MRVGGDLIIATEDGAIPLTQVIQRDPASLELSAVSRSIEPDWRRQYLARDARPWVVLKWPARGLGLFGLPHTQGAEAFAVNLETSAWGQITGWDMQSAAVLGDRAFFGDTAGRVFEMERTGRDGTGVYFSRLQLQVNHLGQVGAAKALKLARATFRSSAPVNVQVSAAVDYAEAFPSAPAAASTEGTPAIFGIGVFGESVFGDDGSGESGGSQPTQDTGWVPIAGYGSAASMQVQVSNGDARKPDGELILLELMYQPGGFLG